MNQEMQNILKKIVLTPGISGSEAYFGITETIFETVKQISNNTIKDAYGNVISVMGSGSKKILIDAHLDEVGFMVSKINNEKIKLIAIGDVNIEKIDNSAAVVLKRNIKGKIVQYNSDAVFEVEKSNQREKICTGDIISFVKSFSKNQKRLLATTLDNRIGCLALISTIRRLSTKNISDLQIIFSFTAGEEKDQSVIDKIAMEYNIDFGIVIDAAYAKPVNFGTDNMTIPELGSGCAIQYLGKDFIVDRKITSTLEKEFNKRKISFQKEIPIPEFGRTNFAKLQLAGKRGCVINIPVKNQHTQESEINTDDFDSTCDAIMSVINLVKKNIL